MSQFTVFAMFTDGIRHTFHLKARSVNHAMIQVAIQYPKDCTIVAVISGHHHDLLGGDYIERTEDIRP